MAARYPMTILLTPPEMARSWLVEHFRRQGFPPRRTLVGVGITLMGIVLVSRAPSPIAWVALAWGGFLVLRPFAFAGLLLMGRRRAKSFTVTVEQRGVDIVGTKGARLVPWSEITAWGLGSDYLWYEIRRSSRATIPFRVMQDRQGVEALFRDRVQVGRPSA